MPSLEHFNPPQLLPPHGYSHVVVARGGTTVYCAGQGAYGANGTLVGGSDLEAQTRQAFQNVLTALRAVGAGWDDVVKVTYYLAESGPEALEKFQRAMNEVVGSAGDKPPAATLVCVRSLAFEEMLIEIDVTAVINE
jgi:enamine deaminase RidA (YjgF/YER057c/UK114 family)